VPDAQIAQRAYDRWGVEEAILEAKQQLGFENTLGWCRKTVNRQAPRATRAGSPASGVVAASNFTQVEVFSPSSTNSGNRCLCPFRGSVNG